MENEWNLPTQLASNVRKYMSTHISEKDIREKYTYHQSNSS